jgi:signal transduction histidine kinase
MYKWYLPTLSEIISLGALLPEKGNGEKSGGFQSPAQQRLRAEREWSAAIAALKQLLQTILPIEQPAPKQSAASSKRLVDRKLTEAKLTEGLLLSGPFPILDQPDLLAQLAAWTFTVGKLGEMPLQLLPAKASSTATNIPIPTLPLLSTDPLAAEQFCLVLTAKFSAVLVLGETPDEVPAFLFSFDPAVVQQAWRSLQARLKMTAPHTLTALNKLVKQFDFVTPDYRTVTQFSHLMLANLPYSADLEEKPSVQAVHALQGIARSLVSNAASSQSTPAIPQDSTRVAQGTPTRSAQLNQFVAQTRVARKTAGAKVEPQVELPLEFYPDVHAGVHAGSQPNSRFDTELLQAIAHEVRTPLTTIRTLTRLLLRRKEMNPDVIKRLEIIDRECTEQIDRFSLIFRAAELEMANGKNSLTAFSPISLAQVLQQNISRWQQQASQHNHTLEVILPQKLPLVVTDPTMLDQMLTGLVDRVTHTLPPGSHIQMQVSQAGHQLKLQLESYPPQVHSEDNHSEDKHFGFAPALKSLGQLLMFQPETGNLSLSMAVTKNLFQALGGKLIVKQRPQQGEVLTIFLPLETKRPED